MFSAPTTQPFHNPLVRNGLAAFRLDKPCRNLPARPFLVAAFHCGDLRAARRSQGKSSALSQRPLDWVTLGKIRLPQ